MIQFSSVLSAESAVVVSHKKGAPSCYVVAFAKTDDEAARRFRAERNRPPSRRSCLQRSMRNFAIVACNRISNCRLRLLLRNGYCYKIMKLKHIALAALLFAGLPLASSFAQVGVSISVAPPVLPVIEQPP